MASSCHYSALALTGKQAAQRHGGCANREIPLQTQRPPPVDSRSFSSTAARASPPGCAGGSGYPAPRCLPLRRFSGWSHFLAFSPFLLELGAPAQSGDREPLLGTLALTAMEDAWADLFMLNMPFSQKWPQNESLAG